MVWHISPSFSCFAGCSNGNLDSEGIQTRAIAVLAGVYFIPGIGKIALTVTGVVIVGGVTYKAGSRIHNKVAVYFAEKAYKKAKKMDLRHRIIQLNLHLRKLHCLLKVKPYLQKI